MRLLGNGADGWTFKGKIGSSKGFFFFFLKRVCAGVNRSGTSYVSREVICIEYCKEKCVGTLTQAIYKLPYGIGLSLVS